MKERVYDFIGVGIGPFNLGLAALVQPINNIDCIFFDNNSEFNWHSGMMLESAHLQTPFLADLVTLADPTHSLSFLNYAKQNGHLYSFYIREDFYLMRKEFNQYCQWVANQLDSLAFNSEVQSIEYLEQEDCFCVTVKRVKQATTANQLSDYSTNDSDSEPHYYYCRKLVLGSGPVPSLPKVCRADSNNIIHSSNYLHHVERIKKNKSITLVGSGQSAAEIFYDLLEDIDSHGYELNWVTRSPRFFPLEYTKLTLEMTSPEYIDYFHQLPSDKRDQLMREQKQLFKGINTCLINDTFDLLYVKRLSDDIQVNMITNSELTECYTNLGEQKLHLSFHQTEQECDFEFETDMAIFASGYQYQQPSYLTPVNRWLCFDEKGRFNVARNYSIDKSASRIFVQNAEIHTHGFVAPDLGMACYRNSCLIREICGEEVYPIEQRIAFQNFDARNFAPAKRQFTDHQSAEAVA